MFATEAAQLFPSDSPFREIVGLLLSGDTEQVAVAKQQLRKLTPKPWDTQPFAEDIARGLLRVALETELPPGVSSDLCFALLRSPYAFLVPPVRAAYERAEEPLRLTLLTLLASIGSRDAAIAVADCVARHGWPRDVYQRLFWELPKLLPHSDVLFPAILNGAESHFIAVGDPPFAAYSDLLRTFE